MEKDIETKILEAKIFAKAVKAISIVTAHRATALANFLAIEDVLMPSDTNTLEVQLDLREYAKVAEEVEKLVLELQDRKTLLN